MKINGMTFDFNAIAVGIVTALNNGVKEKIKDIADVDPVAGKGEEIIDECIRPDLNLVVYTTLAKALPTFIKDTYDMCEYELLHNKDYVEKIDEKVAAFIGSARVGKDVEEYLEDQMDQWKENLWAGNEELRVLNIGGDRVSFVCELDEEEEIRDEDEGDEEEI